MGNPTSRVRELDERLIPPRRTRRLHFPGFRCRALHASAPYQVLTKRSKRLLELANRLAWPPNVWIGVSVEDDRYVFRARQLAEIHHAAVRFVSIEPLLGPVPSLDLRGIDWVIVGGESGPHARPVEPLWVTEIRDRCCESGIPFFFKQW